MAKRLLGRLQHRFGLAHEVPPWWMVRPFTEADFAAAPPAAEDGPRFVGIGCPKAGTTWWHSLILAHPEVEPNRVGRKETQYLCHFGLEPLSDGHRATYRAAFAGTADRVRGEWTPNYLTHPLALERLAAAAPQARLLLMLRNPVDRAISALNHHRSRLDRLRLAPSERRFMWRFSLFPEAFHQGILAPSVSRLFDLFPGHQVLILQYERCNADPAGELRRTYRFLGVDPEFTPPAVERVVNARRHSLPPPDAGTRASIVDFFRPDVERLATLLPGLDLGLWPEFAATGSDRGAAS